MKFKTVEDVETMVEEFYEYSNATLNKLEFMFDVETHDTEGVFGTIIQDITLTVWDERENMVWDEILATREFEDKRDYNHIEHTKEGKALAFDLGAEFWELMES